MNVKDIRRNNMRALAKSVGGITPMANMLGKSQSQISHLIGANPIKNIGDKIAAEVEKIFNKPHGWLDREHFEIREANSYYNAVANTANINPQLVPVIGWDQVTIWPEIPEEIAKEMRHYIPTLLRFSNQGFALKVEGDSMEAPSGISFPEGSIVVVDPNFSVNNRAFVIARLIGEKEVIFRQIIMEGNKRYLKPLNPRYPIIEVNGPLSFCGVVRLMVMEFS